MTEQAGVPDKHFVGDGIPSERCARRSECYFVEVVRYVWTIRLITFSLPDFPRRYRGTPSGVISPESGAAI